MFKFKLQPEEKLLKIQRQAKLILSKPILLAMVLIYIPWSFLLQYDLYGRFKKILIFWTIIIVLYAIYKFLLWTLNVYIVTNKRLIFVNYQSLIHKQVTETPLDRIHNISSLTNGLFHSILKIGEVKVQIASLVTPMILQNIKRPEEFKDFLWTLHSPRRQILHTRNIV